MEEFFSKPTLQHLFAGEDCARAPYPPQQQQQQQSKSDSQKKNKQKKKPSVKIPKFLQNTPYFAAFSKLTENYEIDENYGKEKTKPPLEAEVKGKVAPPKTKEITPKNTSFSDYLVSAESYKVDDPEKK